MKQIIVIAFFILGFQCGFAQIQKHAPDNNTSTVTISPETRARKQAAHAQIELQLNETQTNQWEKAALAHFQANQNIQIQLKGSTTPDERKRLRREIENNNQMFKTTVKSFLNAEQQVKFEKMARKQKGKKSKKRDF
jgi:hypothetical protein